MQAKNFAKMILLRLYGRIASIFIVPFESSVATVPLATKITMIASTKETICIAKTKKSNTFVFSPLLRLKLIGSKN